MNFSFYTVVTDYCDYLRKQDPCVPYTMDKKSIRPFVGIVFKVNGFNYYAPLTSPKQKHLHMKNQMDFLKINEGKWGAINFNNMIPVPGECLNKVELRVFDTDSKADIDYKNLLSNQLSWCNSNKDQILKKAEKLYNMICAGKGTESLINRCCDFVMDEKLCMDFSEHKKSISLNQNTHNKRSVREELKTIKAEQASKRQSEITKIDKTKGAR